jgi:glycosyltransferase involved in cell wall biosynthesis
MTTPSVAVVIPSYNHGRYIEETLGSVFRQTLRPQEVLVIDDGSTDDSVQAIERAFAAASPIRCALTVRENRGISTTRNELGAATTADFVAFLDSDDLYAPNRLERMLEGAPHDGGPYFAFSGVDFLHEREHETPDEWHDLYHLILGQGMAFPTAGFALLRSNIAISASNFVMSRGLLEAVGGFDDRIKICQDWDFAVQALRFVEPTFIPEPLLTYRIHSRNTSRDAQLNATWELDLVIDKLRAWIVHPTPNPHAPTPANWPRFFRIFACLNTHRTGRALAARLLPETLAEPAETEASVRGTKAIRDLISATRSPESIEDLSRNELMMRCRQTWLALS